MQNFDLMGYFGKTVVIIAIVCAAIDFLLNRFCAKLPKFVLKYASGGIAVVASFVADIILKKEFFFSAQAFYSGIVAASMGKLFAFTLNKIINGEKVDKDVIITVIRSFLFGIMGENETAKAAVEIYSVINDLKESQPEKENVKEKIVAIMKSKTVSASDEELEAIADMILSSVTVTLNT